MPSPEHALVVGKFAPLHRGHQLVLDRALEVAGRLTVVVWSNPDFPDMDDEVRAGWLRQLYPQATVVVGVDGPPNDAPGPVHWAYVADLLARHGLTPDVVLYERGLRPALRRPPGAGPRGRRSRAPGRARVGHGHPGRRPRRARPPRPRRVPALRRVGRVPGGRVDRQDDPGRAHGRRAGHGRGPRVRAPAPRRARRPARPGGLRHHRHPAPPAGGRGRARRPTATCSWTPTP